MNDKPQAQPLAHQIRNIMTGPPSRLERFSTWTGNVLAALVAWVLGLAITALVLVVIVVLIVKLWSWGFGP